MRPPRELDGATVLEYAVVTPDVEPTGATRHFRDGALLAPAAALAIARYEDHRGWYLFYLDGAGAVLTDTYHDSVEHARAQAGFEYHGLCWTTLRERARPEAPGWRGSTEGEPKWES